MARRGVLVEPYHRLKPKEAEQIHQASLDISADPGVLYFNRDAAELFDGRGA